MVKPPSRHLFDFLSAYDRTVAALALALREMLLEEAPEAQEKAFGNHPSAVWFGLGPKMNDMFCYIAAATHHVNLGFCRGASLPDPSMCLQVKARPCGTLNSGAKPTWSAPS